MSIYTDSANYDEIDKAINAGWVFGITTNPTILAAGDNAPEKVLQKLSAFDVQEIFYQVKSTTIEQMVHEAEVAKAILGKKLVIKIPPTKIGFIFAKIVAPNNKTCLTAIFNPSQALVAKEIGVNYIAIYVNRATRLLGDGIALTTQCASILNGSKTEILAASLKTTEEVTAASLAGAQHLTLPGTVLESLTTHPLSDQAVEQFNASGTHLAF